MQNLQELKKIGREALEQLRADTLMSGFPYMINAKELPSTECYLEYPDGHISHVSILSAQRDFHIIRNLSEEEVFALRKKYNLREDVYA